MDIASKNGDIVRPGDMWRIPGKGMPTPNGTFGDLIVKFDVIFPSTVVKDRERFAELGLDKTTYKNDENTSRSV